MTPVGYLGELLLLTFRDPRSAARQLFALNLPAEARWLGLLLVSVLTIISAKVMLSTVPADELQAWELAWSDAWMGLPIQIVSMTLFAVAVARIGALFGGTGRFNDALLTVVWIQGALLVPQFVQILLFPILPFLSGLIAIGSVVLFFWLLSHFICALHGFKSTLTAFFGVLGALVVLVIVFAILFSFLGVLPPPPGS